MSSPIAVQGYGNNVAILMNDGSRILAVKTRSNYWLVTGAEPSGGGGEIKFPFPRAQINMASYYGHSGVDWPGGTVGVGADIHAVMAGVVHRVYANPVNNPSDFGEPQWRGNCVVINHGVIDGITIWSLYAHMLNAPTLSEGDPVSAGQIVGQVGNTGASSGAHLHFEIIYNGDRLETDTPGNNTPGLGFTRTLNWLDAHAVGSWV